MQRKDPINSVRLLNISGIPGSKETPRHRVWNELKYTQQPSCGQLCPPLLVPVGSLSRIEDGARYAGQPWFLEREASVWNR